MEQEKNNYYDIAAEIGLAFLDFVWTMRQAGHVTLRGHLRYHHEEQYEPIRQDIVKFLRWASSYGEEERLQVGYPDDLLKLANEIRAILGSPLSR
jgi:hypothetical protein